MREGTLSFKGLQGDLSSMLLKENEDAARSTLILTSVLRYFIMSRLVKLVIDSRKQLNLINASPGLMTYLYHLPLIQELKALSVLSRVALFETATLLPAPFQLCSNASERRRA